jgi:transcription factor E
MKETFVKEAVSTVVGKAMEGISDLLLSKRHVNEFIISKKMGITINQVRNLLYKLSDKGLVSSIRKKDKKKGWYTYFWRIEVLKTLLYLREIFQKRKNLIDEQISGRKSKQYYSCERCKVEFDEATALLQDFTCNECGGIFSLEDNSALIKELTKNSEKANKKLLEIDEEIEKEETLLEKEKQKELNRVALEKKKISAKKAELRAAKRKKENSKKNSKNKVDTRKSSSKKAAKKTKSVSKASLKKKSSSKKTPVKRGKTSGVRSLLKKALAKKGPSAKTRKTSKKKIKGKK